MTKDDTQTRTEWLEQELRKWRHKNTQCNRRVKDAEIHLQKVTANIDIQRKAAEDYLKEELGHLDYAVEYRKQLQEEYDALFSKPKPKPVVKLENGKVRCQYCSKEFSPQNIGRHEKKCKKEFDKETEKAKIMARLEELDKDIPIPVEIPEPPVMPTIEQKLELVKEVKVIINDKKAELEAELDLKEGE